MIERLAKALLLTCLALGGTQIIVAQSALPFNQTFVFGVGSVHSMLIATLPASNAGTYDHLHFLASLNTGDSSYQTSYFDGTFGNRNAFTYAYDVRGIQSVLQSKIVAYQTGGAVNIYMVLGSQYVSGGFTILEAENDTIPASFPDLGATTPNGTLVFDSSNIAAYPPGIYTDFQGNTTFGGNVSLSSGKGGSMTFQDGSVQTVAWNGVLSGGDYAESVDVGGDRGQYEPGDVLVIDHESAKLFLKSSEPYSTAVMGIYSTRPGIVGRRQRSNQSHMKEEVPMAMIGVVPTKVCTEGGAIRPGDLLVTSSRLGYAMKGMDRTRLTGAIIGKALEHLDKDTGIIEVAVSLQ